MRAGPRPGRGRLALANVGVALHVAERRGAAKALSFDPLAGPFSPSPWLGSVWTKSSTASTINMRKPTSQAYLLPARGSSGRRAGSGWVRSRSASRSPIERSSKRSLSLTRHPPRSGAALAGAVEDPGHEAGRRRAARPTSAPPAARSSRHSSDTERSTTVTMPKSRSMGCRTRSAREAGDAVARGRQHRRTGRGVASSIARRRTGAGLAVLAVARGQTTR